MERPQYSWHGAEPALPERNFQQLLSLVSCVGGAE